MELSRIGASQDSSFFYIALLSTPLTPEGIIVLILKRILDEISGEIVDESGELLGDEFGNSIGFDNSDFYPEMPLFLWRKRFLPGWEEIQIVYLIKEYQ